MPLPVLPSPLASPAPVPAPAPPPPPTPPPTQPQPAPSPPGPSDLPAAVVANVLPPPTMPCTAPATRVVPVTTGPELVAALAAARPGDRIELADGTYVGRFSAVTSGAEAAPIAVCGSRAAVLDGGSLSAGYAFRLRADRWNLVGFSVTNAQKGIVLDGASRNLIERLDVRRIGTEAIHLRAHSSHNTVRDNDISDTGLRTPQYGEGIYVGSAVNNWCLYTLCGPDRSDDNALVGNRIARTTAEGIDVKEGTTGGLVEENSIDGSGRAAQAWVDVKGNDWVVRGNRGVSSAMDGFRTTIAAPGWGTGSTFEANVADVRGPGYGFNLAPGAQLRCDNVVTAAAKGYANQACSG
jgi:hypothetical protein